MRISHSRKFFKSIMRFTLLELLIVIAIIAILACILMPALNKSKQTARRISCIGNLKQIALAFGGYDSDYNGYFPIAKQYNPSITWYYDLLPPYINDLKIGRRDLEHPAIKAIYCNAQPTNSTATIYFSYGYNASVYYANGTVAIDASHTMYLPLKSNQAKKPSTTCLMTDSEDQTVYYKASDPVQPVAFRHTGGTNVLFLDAHVNWFKLLDVPDYNREGVSAAANPFWNPLK